MIKSMTGYGSSKDNFGNKTISVEVKTLNSKYLDLSLKNPKEFSHLELSIRTIVTNSLERGKVNLTLDITDQENDLGSVKINESSFRNIYQQLEKLADELKADKKDLFRIVFNIPDVSGQEHDKSELLGNQILESIKKALEQCDQFRQKEGETLKNKFGSYIKAIALKLDRVIELDPLRIENIRSRISKNITNFVEEEKIDKNRLEQEIIYYTERLDITEEKVRLKKHLDHFEQVLENSRSQGKKLGFIAQEIGREINTIGSKANDVGIQECVIGMKEELEKIKEQVLNIL